jgi:parvulin-like peptidyl-prolyl isomerase
MKKSVFLYSLLVLIAASGVFAYLKFFSTPVDVAPPTEKLLATVNGDPITTAVFEEKYRRFARRANISAESASKHELKMGFLNKLIETNLLLQETEVRGLTVTEEELNREILQLKEDYPKDTLNETLEKIGLKLEEWKEERREKLLIDKLIQQEIDSIIHVSDDEIGDYYQKNKDQFQQPLQVWARQIVVATEEEAAALRSLILKGEDFEEIARQNSLSPDAEKGGDLGVFSKGQMPEEFDDVVFRYREGTVSRVVQSPYGFHIFKVEKRINPRTLSIDEVRDEIASRIFRERQESFFKEWLDSLKRQAKITIYPETLEGI